MAEPMFSMATGTPGGRLRGLLAEAMPNPAGSYRGNLVPVIRMPDGSMEPAVPEMLRSGLLGLAELFDAGKAAGAGEPFAISGEGILSLPASSAVAGAAIAPRGALASGAVKPVKVFQGRSRKGLTEFFNPDGNAWGTTSKETAEQFAGKDELSKFYPNYPGEVYDLEFDLKNPMTVSYKDTLWDRVKELEKIKEAKALGYDGLKIDFGPEKTDYVAFYPEQVRRVVDASLIKMTDAEAAKLTPAERLDIAQRNAALPVEKGGLGLPADNTPEMRARAMGFDTDAYHGGKSDIVAFDEADKLNAEGGAAFLAKNNYGNPAATANSYAGRNGVVYPLRVKTQNFLEAGVPTPTSNASSADIENWMKDVDKFNERMGFLKTNYFNSKIEQARAKGKGGVSIRNIQDNKYDVGFVPEADVFAVVNPRNIRSRFAAFDPARSDSADLLASNAPAPGLLGLLGMTDRDAPRRSDRGQMKRR